MAFLNMKRERMAWALILLSAPLFGQLKITGRGPALLIKNARLLPVTSVPVDNGSVLIVDGKIKSFGKEVKAPRECRVIDASGYVVMPGIIDSHSHMGSIGNINEMTGPVVPEVRITDVIDHDDLAFQRALAGGVTCINTLHGSANVIGGFNAVLKLKFGRPADELLVEDAVLGIKFALGENPKRSNMEKRIQRFPASRMGVIYSVRKALTDAREYQRHWQEYESKKRGKLKKSRWEKAGGLLPPRRDLRLEALAKILTGEAKIMCHAYRADEMLALMELGDEMGFKVHSFEHCLEGFKIADEIAAHGAIASSFADFWGYKMEAFDAIPYNAAILASHGVLVTLNSDSAERTRRLYQEAARVLKYGDLSESDALKMITLNPAIMLGIDHRTGSIEAGKDADLAIFNGHPFSVYSRVEMTLIEGEVFFDRNTAPTVESVLAGGQE